jgi:hypothetical protein
LPASRRAQFEKALKQAQVLHFNELACVALDIDHQVVGKPLYRGNTAVMDWRIQATPQQIVQAGNRNTALLQFLQ